MVAIKTGNVKKKNATRLSSNTIYYNSKNNNNT